MPRARALAILAVAVLALAAFGPTFVLVSLVSFGALGTAFGNALLLLDLAGAFGALATAVLAFRESPWTREVGLASAVAGLVALAGFLFATWPWTTEAVAVRNLALLHLWAPALAALSWTHAR